MAQRVCASPQSLQSAYDHLLAFPTKARLCDAALGVRLHASNATNGAVPGRSIAWKLFLLRPSAPLLPDSPVDIMPYLQSLRLSRVEFRDLLLEKMRAPDGSYEENLVIPGLQTSPPRRSATATAEDLATNNPLSLHVENPWKDWFASIDLRKTITQDVERTFPDVSYFRDPEVQAQLANVLYIWSSTHPEIGYRQGMHELLAMLYFAVDFDSVAAGSSVAAPLDELCAQTWVAGDAWALFVHVMNGVGRWYEWREPPLIAPANTSSPTTQGHPPQENGLIKTNPYVSPIVQACNEMQNVHLKSVDPQLWHSLQAAGIEPQIYGIRWLRLLFTREFGMIDSMVLWDGLFACDTSFDIAKWICVAMLIRIRNHLIPADYSGQLTCLLRYPPAPEPDPIAIADTHPTSLLLRQAIALQLSPSPLAGVSVMTENRNIFNIPLEVPEPLPPPIRKQGRPRGGVPQPGITGSLRGGHSRQLSAQALGLPDIARGLLDRGESLGINKSSIFNAVSDFRKNLPDLAASAAASAANFVRTPTTPGYPAFPLVDERASEERPPWEPRTRNEMENEIARLKAMQMQLGASLGWIVDALGKDSETEDEEDEVKKLAKRKGEALESLQYIRDVLQRGITNLEDDKLWGEDELRKQKERALQIPIVEQRPATTPPTAPPPTTIFSPTPEIATQTATLPRSFSRFQLPSAAVISYPDSPSPPVAGIPTPSLLSPNAQDTQLSSWKRPTMSSFGPSSPPRVSGFAAPGSQPRSPPPVTSLPRSPQPSSGILPRSPGLPTPKIAAANMAASPATSTSSLPQTPPVPFALNLPPSAKSDKDRRQRQEAQNDPLGALH